MPEIIWPTAFEADVVNKIRDAIGRETIWYVVASSTPCPICSLDPVTNTSVDSFCPVCSGVYWIDIYSGVSISGHITWGKYGQLSWQTGGQLYEGDCRVQIQYTPGNVIVTDTAKYVVVDDKKLTVFKKTYRGVQTINRIVIDLLEEEENV